MYSYKDLLSQLVKAFCLSGIVTDTPFPSMGPPFSPVQVPPVMFRTPGSLSEIVTEAPPSQHSLKDSPLSAVFDCDAPNTWPSYETELRTAESIGETSLPFASRLPY